MNDTQSTRARIISEATRLFAANGIKATTVAHIEVAVGLRKGSGGVHRYFATKEDLVAAVLGAQLESGEETLATAQQSLPLPHRDQAGEYLRALGHLVLSEAEKNREVALILLRDAHALDSRAETQQRRNDALAYGATAAAVREIQAVVGNRLSIDADAYGYVLLAPLIYFKLIDWATGRRPLDVESETLVDTWAAVMEPMFHQLIEMRQTADNARSE
jgi:AcrR family transcriptional regulator